MRVHYSVLALDIMDHQLLQHQHHHPLAHPHTRPPKRKADSQFDDTPFDDAYSDLDPSPAPTPTPSPRAAQAALPDDDRPQKRRRANSLPNLAFGGDVEMHEQVSSRPPR